MGGLSATRKLTQAASAESSESPGARITGRNPRLSEGQRCRVRRSAGTREQQQPGAVCVRPLKSKSATAGGLLPTTPGSLVLTFRPIVSGLDLWKGCSYNSCNGRFRHPDFRYFVQSLAQQSQRSMEANLDVFLRDLKGIRRLGRTYVFDIAQDEHRSYRLATVPPLFRAGCESPSSNLRTKVRISRHERPCPCRRVRTRYPVSFVSTLQAADGSSAPQGSLWSSAAHRPVVNEQTNRASVR